MDRATFGMRSCGRLVVCAWWLATGSAHGQIFTHYGPADGLSSAAVLRMLPDQRGPLWFATRAGLDRFDGASFLNFRPDAKEQGALPHAHVERMHQASDGMLWLTSGHGGLTRHDPRTGRFHTWTALTGAPDPAQDLPTRAVFAYRPDSILVGVFGQGLWWYLPRTGATVPIPGPAGGPCTPEEITSRPGHPEELYLREGGAVWLLHIPAGSWTPIPIPPMEVGEGLAPVSAIHAQGADTVWVGTWGGGLVRVLTGSGAASRFLPDPSAPLTRAKNIILALALEPDGACLVGTERGLLRLDPVDGTFRPVALDPADPRALPAEAVHDLWRGEDGILWVARASGLSKWDPAENRFTNHALRNRIERAFALPRVGTALELDGRLLLGTTHGDGLLRENEDGQYEALPNRTLASEGHATVQVHALVRTRGGSPVAFTGKGIHRVEERGDRLVPMLPRTSAALGSGAIMAFMEDTQGRWWMSRQSRGLVVCDPAQDDPVIIGEEGPAHRRLSSASWCQGLAQDRSGHVWVTAYEKGLDRITPDLQRVDAFLFKEHAWMRTGRIWDLLIDAEDRLWLGTNGHGIIVTPASDPGGAGTMHLLGGPSAIPAMVSSLAMDATGYLWAAGPSGLLRIDPRTFTVKHYGPSEGLRDTDLHHAFIRDHPSGRLTLSARDGVLVSVAMNELDAVPGPLRMAITGISINGRPIASQVDPGSIGALSLAPGEDHIEVAFSAIAFSLRDRIAITYQMMGVDPLPHTDGAQGRATYSKLPPGTHRLVFRDALRPQEELLALTITLRPWFWRTTWFAVLAGLALVLLVAALWTWRLHVLRDRDRVVAEQQRRVAAFELQALRAQMDPHFLFNSLNSINRFIIRNEARIASEHLTKFARLIRRVLQHSRERLIPLKDELEALRLYVELEALRFSDGFSYRAEVELAEDPATIMVPPMLLQPYVENAIWHGLMHKRDGDRRLVIRVRSDGDSTVFEVEDNGIGRTEAMRIREEQDGQRRSMGMRLNSERIALLGELTGVGASVQVVDLHDLHQRPTGTRVVVRISPRKA